MQIWMTLALALQMLSALAMIGLVLIQHGKGADMGASFGSGASGSLFGASGSANFLSRSTAVCATLFFVSTLLIGVMSDAGSRTREATGGSVLDRPAEAASAPAVPAIPAVVPQTPPAPAVVVPEAEPPSASAPAGAAASAVIPK